MVKVEKLIPGGMALGTLENGKKIFFWNALPGEIVTDYQVTKRKSHYDEAIANAIESPSNHRVTPKDTCFLSTSPWQIMDYKFELESKQALVTELFSEHQISIDTPIIRTDNKDYFYRNKMEYALYWDNDTNKISLAFHTRGSHRKMPINSSSIERPEILSKALSLVEDLNTRHEEARKYQSLLLRANQQGEVSGGFYENHRPHTAFPNLKDVILGQEYFYSPNGFFQINLPVYEMALSEIQKHVSTKEVLDLYAGVGTIGLSVARGHHLTLVECDKPAYQELVENTSLSKEHFPSVTPVLDKSENVTDYIKPDQTVILDPPRAGCDLKLINKLLEVSPAKIIYLSCNPATEARDVKLLLSKYHIDKIETYNFFPRTPHIENLVVLSL